MKKKLGLMLAAFTVVSIMASSMASAAYNPTNNINVNVTVFPGQVQAPSTGDATFNMQESVHNTITNTTGTSVDHSYIWINVNGTPVLAVDPPVAMF